MPASPAPTIARRIARVGLLALTADQLSKLAAHTLAAGHTNGAVVPVHNHDFSLGIAHATVPVTVVIMAIGIVAVGGYLFHVSLRGQIPAWATGLLIGGALSNLADRLATGSVRDFLATPWIVLNLADLAVVIGLAGWLIHRTHPTPTRKEVIP